MEHERVREINKERSRYVKFSIELIHQSAECIIQTGTHRTYFAPIIFLE